MRSGTTSPDKKVDLFLAAAQSSITASPGASSGAYLLRDTKCNVGIGTIGSNNLVTIDSSADTLLQINRIL